MSAGAPEPSAFRAALSQFATGVTVITIQQGDSIHGMTANSFTSVSMDPPLVLFCVARTTRMAALIEQTDGFAINVLAAQQETVSRQFAGSQKTEAARSISLERGPVAPLIDGALAALSCVTEAIHAGGDHWIVVGRVVAVHGAVRADSAPLVFFRSRYHDLAERRAPAPGAETWANDAIRVYHDEWSVDPDDATDHTNTLPWESVS